MQAALNKAGNPGGPLRRYQARHASGGDADSSHAQQVEARRKAVRPEGAGEVRAGPPPSPTPTQHSLPAGGACRAGFEPSESAEFTEIHVDSRTDDRTRVDVSARELVAFGPTKTGDLGTVEDSLARAIAQASVVGRWDIVAQLARELEARRLSAAGVRSLVDKRGRRPDQE